MANTSRKGTYSKEYKLSVVKYVQEGHSNAEAAAKFGVSSSSISTWKKKFALEAKASSSQKTVASKPKSDAKKPSTTKTPSKKVAAKKPVATSKTAKKTTQKKSEKKSSNARPAKKPINKKRRTSKKKVFLKLLLQASLACSVLFSAFIYILSNKVIHEFEARQVAIPARVFARPLVLYAGASISSAQLQFELDLLGYSQVNRVTQKGEYSLHNHQIRLAGRDFLGEHGMQMGQNLQVTFAYGSIKQLHDQHNQPLQSSQLEPANIGVIYPYQGEDRIQSRLKDIPVTMLQGLIATEDKAYYEHFGISPVGIARAVVANAQAGRKVQGGSTLTQQLVKNLFLTNERSYVRKINEVFMAMILDFKYDKDLILETYINEVFLAQDGARAIHGLGLASQFYFGKPINELNIEQQALLIGIIKGPSFYNPKRHVKRATERRNLVLSIMRDSDIISSADYQRARQQGLNLNPHKSGQKYPAFIDLVKAELKKDFPSEQLSNDGLKIFTAFDPWIQKQVQQQASLGLDHLEKEHKLAANILQMGAIVTAVHSGEVLAVIGDRKASYSGFNRALNAIRNPGSLLKPAIALAAIEDQHLNLASQVADEPITLKAGNNIWSPKNYNGRSQGQVLLYQMLEKSINQSAVILGEKVGLSNYLDWLKKLGIERQLPTLPSVYLGGTGMSVLDITRLYQTLANQGRKANVRAVKAVLDDQGTALSRYPANAEQIADTRSVYQVNHALQHVMHTGTGKYAYTKLPYNLSLAGKTGTTNDQRDSWFAGFTGNHLAVVWVGRDDNGKTPLTGSSGALRIWTDMIRQMNPVPVLDQPPVGIEFVNINKSTGKAMNNDCENGVRLPFKTPIKASLKAGLGC